MTREAFIRKWLANKDFQYCEDGRAQMREDLDKVIDNAKQKLNIASVVRPKVEGAQEGELLGNEAVETKPQGGYCECDFVMIMRDELSQIAYCAKCDKEVNEQ